MASILSPHLGLCIVEDKFPLAAIALAEILHSLIGRGGEGLIHVYKLKKKQKNKIVKMNYSAAWYGIFSVITGRRHRWI